MGQSASATVTRRGLRPRMGPPPTPERGLSPAYPFTLNLLHDFCPGPLASAAVAGPGLTLQLAGLSGSATAPGVTLALDDFRLGFHKPFSFDAGTGGRTAFDPLDVSAAIGARPADLFTA